MAGVPTIAAADLSVSEPRRHVQSPHTTASIISYVVAFGCAFSFVASKN
jgi:hypothetical protein